MGQIINKNQFADVICQHKTDGTIIPLRIRIKDEDGIYQEFNIKGYKDLTHAGSYALPNGVSVSSNHLHSFECKIMVFNQQRLLKLFYNAYDCKWQIVDVK